MGRLNWPLTNHLRLQDGMDPMTNLATTTVATQALATQALAVQATPTLRGARRGALSLVILLAGTTVAAAAEPTPTPALEPEGYVRFLDGGQWNGRLQTSVIGYRDGAGRTVDLLGAVHVGDGAYYRELERRFRGYDALLYELVAPEGTVPRAGEGSGSWLSLIQRGMKNALALEFQLDAIDYSAPNFVHADLDPWTFQRLQRERGESFLNIFLRTALNQWGQQLQGRGPGSSMTTQDLVAALASEDARRSLKYLMGREMQNMEALMAGLDTEQGSVILTERNKRAIEVLERELAAGRERLGIFYGAAHLPDLHERLLAFGFELVRFEWLTAWEIGAGAPSTPAATPVQQARPGAVQGTPPEGAAAGHERPRGEPRPRARL